MPLLFPMLAVLLSTVFSALSSATPSLALSSSCPRILSPYFALPRRAGEAISAPSLVQSTTVQKGRKAGAFSTAAIPQHRQCDRRCASQGRVLCPLLLYTWVCVGFFWKHHSPLSSRVSASSGFAPDGRRRRPWRLAFCPSHTCPVCRVQYSRSLRRPFLYTPCWSSTRRAKTILNASTVSSISSSKKRASAHSSGCSALLSFSQGSSFAPSCCLSPSPSTEVNGHSSFFSFSLASPTARPHHSLLSNFRASSSPSFSPLYGRKLAFFLPGRLTTEVSMVASPAYQELSGVAPSSSDWGAGEWGEPFSPSSSRQSSPSDSPCCYLNSSFSFQSPSFPFPPQKQTETNALAPVTALATSLSSFSSLASADTFAPDAAASDKTADTSPSTQRSSRESPASPFPCPPLSHPGGKGCFSASRVLPLPLKRLHFDQVDSTQKWCLRNLETLCSVHGLSPSTWVAVSASRQTAAVGTRDSVTLEEKKWISPPNNVSVTYVIPWPIRLSSRLLNFAQTAAVAVCKVLDAYGLRGQIKWINDVFVNDKKICGVLCHNPAFVLPSALISPAVSAPRSDAVAAALAASSSSSKTQGSPPGLQALHAQLEGDSYWAVLVGVGINVEKKPEVSEMAIEQATTSIAEELERVGGERNRNRSSCSDVLKNEMSSPDTFTQFPDSQEKTRISTSVRGAPVDVGGVAREKEGGYIGAERKPDTEEGTSGTFCGHSLSSTGPGSSFLNPDAIRASLDTHMYESFNILQREGFKALRPFVLSRLAWLGDYVELEEKGSQASAWPTDRRSCPTDSEESARAYASACGTSRHGVTGSEDDENVFTDVGELSDGLERNTACDTRESTPEGSTAGSDRRRFSAGERGSGFLATGILQGLDEDGALLIRMPDGRTQKFVGGHLVRP
ncbi:biotin-acetyl-CoA-carboxylase ligase [Toxoplasma gondii VAND]|uniref:Biotin-acetyl-CoA-carboxylase ligase n=1 Tax=Toxoplasma gondii VAND TaxID=933077 RepID=A0A086Q8V1_TOXGO|nr:biotin-acetyl-CoA-carboxylase ligase [Toxoplasma gondii VAND]